MPAALAGPLARIRSVLSTISLGQKVVIGLLAVGLLLGGFFFYNWITAPTLSPLFSNLASTDASAIVDELNAEGVSYQLADGGSTIMVPNDQVYNLRLTMSGKGLPAGQDTGYSLLDQQGITTSEFQQQVTYQRAVEGELAKTLEAIKGVNTAVVHIALPKDQVFVADQGKPTASVLLDLGAGTQLSGEQISAVTNLVSSSIEGMDPKDVTVADSDGQVLSAAGQVSAAAGDQRSAMETDYEDRLAANAQKILDQVLGPNHAVVSVRADLDLSQRQSTSETYSYNQGTPPISSSQSTETYSGTGGAVGGVLGPENTGTATGSGNSAYNKSDTTDNNAVDKTTTTTQDAPGSIKRLTVSVVMDGTVAGNLNQQQVQSLIGNAVGLDTARGDAIPVAAMAFDSSAAQQAKA
jgi:flagellar M-ring protein FliF